MGKLIKIHKFKDGKVIGEDRIAYANGEYVLFSDFQNEIQSRNDYITQLKHDLEKTYNQLMETEKEAQDRITELEYELEVNDNLLKIKNGLLGNNDDLPTEPMEVAQMLINSTYERETSTMERAFYKCGDTEIVQRYSINVLEQIAEHLLVYCKHNREDV